MPSCHVLSRSVWFTVCCAVSLAACEDLGPSAGDEEYSSGIGLVQDASQDTTWATLYVVIEHGPGGISEVRLWIEHLLSARCAVSAVTHVDANDEGPEREDVSCAWDDGTVDLSIAHVVDYWHCSLNGGECPPSDVLSIDAGALRFRKSDRQWHNATSFSDFIWLE